MKRNSFLFTALLLTFVVGCNKPDYYHEGVVDTKATGIEVFTGDSLLTTWKFTAQNKLNKDYSLPENQNAAYIMLPLGKGLTQEKEIKWNTGTYLPPDEKISISFQVNYEYTDSFTRADKDSVEKLSKYISNKINEIEAFVIIDKKNKYKIVFKNEYRDSTKNKKLKPVL